MSQIGLINSDVADVKLFAPPLFEDPRGWLFESWNRRQLEAHGIGGDFVQDNHSFSKAGVLRGLHYQLRRPQAKLVRALSGSIFDVAVDLRAASPSFGKWTGRLLSADSRQSMWIPQGFAHGFLALTDAEVLYKCSDIYDPADQHTLLWNDPGIAIAWPLAGAAPILSDKDRAGLQLSDSPAFP